MKPKATIQKLIEAKKEEARRLFKRGLTTREIGVIVSRSHAWVANAVKNTPVDK